MMLKKPKNKVLFNTLSSNLKKKALIQESTDKSHKNLQRRIEMAINVGLGFEPRSRSVTGANRSKILDLIV